MKKLISIFLIMTVIVSAFAVESNASLTFSWDHIATSDAFTINFEGSRDFYNNEDFTAQIVGNLGFNIALGDILFKMTSFIAPAITFKDIITKDVDLRIAAGCKMFFLNGYDVGVGVDIHTNYWVTDLTSTTLGLRISRFFVSNKSEYGAYLGFTTKF